MTDSPLILNQLNYSINSQVTILKDISLSLTKNSITGLLGVNGAGKSTLLSICAGARLATSGNVSLNIPKAKISYLPETPPLIPNFKVIDYLHYISQLKQLSPSTAELNDILEVCDLLEKKHQIIATLSKGNRQRVGIAQALLNKPELLLLDEPMSGLDPAQIATFRQLLAQLKSTTTIFFSTHILAEIETLCDQSVILHNKHTYTVDHSQGNETYTATLQGQIKIANGFFINGNTQVNLDSNETLNIFIKQAIDNNWQIIDISLDKNTPERAFLDAIKSNNLPAHSYE